MRRERPDDYEYTETPSLALSPVVDVESIEGGHRLTITDIHGKKSFDVMNGPQGDPYVLTDSDKAELVSGVLSALPTWEGGSY